MSKDSWQIEPREGDILDFFEDADVFGNTIYEAESSSATGVYQLVPRLEKGRILWRIADKSFGLVDLEAVKKRFDSAMEAVAYCEEYERRLYQENVLLSAAEAGAGKKD